MKDYNAMTLLIFGLGFLAGKNFHESCPKKFMKGNLFFAEASFCHRTHLPSSDSDSNINS